MTTIFWVTIALSVVALLLSAWVFYRLFRMDLVLRGMEMRVDHMIADEVKKRAARLHR